MQPNKVTSGQVANIVLKTMQTRQIRYCCRAIIAADDADDPNDHAVFSQMQKPKAAWKLANEEERKFVDLPEGGKAMFRALVLAWVKVELNPDSSKRDDEEDKPRRANRDDDE